MSGSCSATLQPPEKETKNEERFLASHEMTVVGSRADHEISVVVGALNIINRAMNWLRTRSPVSRTSLCRAADRESPRPRWSHKKYRARARHSGARQSPRVPWTSQQGPRQWSANIVFQQ